MREWLGGFMACGVFAPIFVLCLAFRPAFPLFVLFALVVFRCPLDLSLLSCFVFVALCGCVVVVSFSLSDYTQKERA